MEQQLDTIIDEAEQRRRKTIANREARRGRWNGDRGEYLLEQAERRTVWRRSGRRWTNPDATQAELAAALGVERRSYISKLAAKINM
jgi:hypothetical protein